MSYDDYCEYYDEAEAGEDELENDELDEDELENDPTYSDHYKEMMLDAAAERYAEGKVYDPLTHGYIDRSDVDPGDDNHTAEEELFDDELAMYYADRASFLDDMDRSSSDGWFYGDDY